MSIHGERVRFNMLHVGLKLWPNVTAHSVARQMKMHHSSVLYHFGTAGRLRDAVASHAVMCKNARVIRFLIAEKHSAIATLSRAELADYFAQAID